MAAVPAPDQITRWLNEWRHGDVEASERLFEVVQPQLQHMAASVLRGERRDHTLEPNALVNELFVRWLGSPPITFTDRVHFFALAAKTMRRILIDHARGRGTEKRGGDRDRITLSAVDGWNPVARYDDILALDAALSKLERADARAGRVVELRFFGGLLEEEIAEVLGVSVITVKRDWKVARAWLMNRLRPDE
jgi:RNA polymerase sigma-70 factor (ECF subfamily)